MATKIVRAQDILKEKGFSVPKFDTAGFQSAVVDFFRKSDVSAILTVFSVRFLDYEGTPEGGFYACTDYTDSGDHICIPGKWYDYPLPPFLGGYFGKLGRTDEIGFPYILVDEPYMTNAVGLLKLCGFVVGRKRRVFGIPSYDVKLV